MDADHGGVLTLNHPLVYRAPCPTATSPVVTIDMSVLGNGADSSLDNSDPDSPHFSDFRDPFYASSFPICYALAATTVTAYMLVIMLFITPRSFFDSGVVYLGRRGGFTDSSNGGTISIGGRPWLQKVAALTVAISLSIATADTFKIAKIQYLWGAQNAKVLQHEVMGSTELKVIRLISDTFLWLAQAQTLIRLFPRHREKVIIKWVAFALISLDVIFSALNSFVYDLDVVGGSQMHKSFEHPVAALSYLFQLLLGVLYAAWVVYYALMKKRYAFYHPLMKNMCLVATISITSIVIPVVFFVLDISKPKFTGWGDYVRWVGAAAASVVVWEWVERIEALEREEKKDGILGREVFDGDDTLEINASDFPWLRHRKNRKGGGSDDPEDGTKRQGSATSNGWPSVSTITRGGRNSSDAQQPNDAQTERTRSHGLRPPIWLTRPTPVLTPVSRTDTTSAASTVYAVRYQSSSDAATRTPDPPIQLQSMVELSRQNSSPRSNPTNEDTASSNHTPVSANGNGHIILPAPTTSFDLDANTTTPGEGRVRTSPNSNSIYQRGGDDLSTDAASVVSVSQSISPRRIRDGSNRWDVRSRLEEFAASQADKVREKLRPTTNTDNLTTTVIPAPPRRGAALQQVLEEEEVNNPGALARNTRGLSDGDSSEELSADTANRNRQDHAQATPWRRGDGTIPSTNPPLWPGVGPRHFMYADDDAYSYDDSATETSSVMSREQEHTSAHEIIGDSGRTAAGPSGGS